MWTPEKVKAEPMEADEILAQLFEDDTKTLSVSKLASGEKVLSWQVYDVCEDQYYINPVVQKYSTDANLLPDILAKLTALLQQEFRDNLRNSVYKYMLWDIDTFKPDPWYLVQIVMSGTVPHELIIACLLNVLEETR